LICWLKTFDPGNHLRSCPLPSQCARFDPGRRKAKAGARAPSQYGSFGIWFNRWCGDNMYIIYIYVYIYIVCIYIYIYIYSVYIYSLYIYIVYIYIHYRDVKTKFTICFFGFWVCPCPKMGCAPNLMGKKSLANKFGLTVSTFSSTKATSVSG
jgi:hypothetical protein